jgi:archaetidylinositol phosphate synthase
MLLFIVDKLDGVLARAGNHVSKWGGLLDATLDRISDSLIYIAIGYSGSADWGLCSIAMLMGLLVSYSKAKAEAGLGISNIGSNQMSIGLMERTERLVLVGVSLFVYYFVSKDLVFNLNIVEIVLVISIILTFLTFVMRMKKAHELLKAQ